ncbi:PP0621 family protein [Noviherbaspirillum sp.]|uniref:PP0621 family protein n=1 Tax=Noviherbaspirillum sp. TaxID=1926288 RepID=UPI002D525E21|nr:PP0621 family protein [Noviherbaspirillum sp.]HZW20077.1 PP0621 family protein [Noviherbaspirillum sp.]
MKILLWVLVAAAIVIWLTHAKKQRVQAPRDNAEPARPAVESMLRCAHCGTYFPASEAVTLPSGIHFCCEEHRLRHSSPDTAA